MEVCACSFLVGLCGRSYIVGCMHAPFYSVCMCFADCCFWLGFVWRYQFWHNSPTVDTFDLNILDLFWFYAGCVSFAWISSLTSLSGWGVSNNSQGISRPLHCKCTCHLESRVLFNKNTVINLDVLGKSIVFWWHVPLLWAEWNMVRKDSYSAI